MVIKIELLVDFYKEKKEPCEEDEEVIPPSKLSIMKLSNEDIEVEDEIKFNHLREKYKKSPK